MRPEVVFAGEERAATRVTVLIVKADPGEATDRFRHFYRRTNDPADRHDAATAYLSAGYYQRPAEFADEMSALFGPGDTTAERLRSDGRCVLRFAQYEQSYVVPCRVRALDDTDPAFQATYWHNILFNPDLPADVRILGFSPQWDGATAEPAPPAYTKSR